MPEGNITSGDIPNLKIELSKSKDVINLMKGWFLDEKNNLRERRWVIQKIGLYLIDQKKLSINKNQFKEELISILGIFNERINEIINWKKNESFPDNFPSFPDIEDIEMQKELEEILKCMVWKAIGNHFELLDNAEKLAEIMKIRLLTVDLLKKYFPVEESDSTAFKLPIPNETPSLNSNAQPFWIKAPYGNESDFWLYMINDPVNAINKIFEIPNNYDNNKYNKIHFPQILQSICLKVLFETKGFVWMEDFTNNLSEGLDTSPLSLKNLLDSPIDYPFPDPFSFASRYIKDSPYEIKEIHISDLQLGDQLYFSLPPIADRFGPVFYGSGENAIITKLLRNMDYEIRIDGILNDLNLTTERKYTFVNKTIKDMLKGILEKINNELENSRKVVLNHWNSNGKTNGDILSLDYNGLINLILRDPTRETEIIDSGSNKTYGAWFIEFWKGNSRESFYLWKFKNNKLRKNRIIAKNLKSSSGIDENYYITKLNRIRVLRPRVTLIEESKRLHPNECWYSYKSADCDINKTEFCKHLQIHLKEFGFLHEDYPVQGVKDKDTEDALKNFQKIASETPYRLQKRGFNRRIISSPLQFLIGDNLTDNEITEFFEIPEKSFSETLKARLFNLQKEIDRWALGQYEDPYFRTLKYFIERLVGKSKFPQGFNVPKELNGDWQNGVGGYAVDAGKTLANYDPLWIGGWKFPANHQCITLVHFFLYYVFSAYDKFKESDSYDPPERSEWDILAEGTLSLSLIYGLKEIKPPLANFPLSYQNQ